MFVHCGGRTSVLGFVFVVCVSVLGIRLCLVVWGYVGCEGVGGSIMSMVVYVRV